MSVIPLTVFCSLLLVACFVGLFIREQRHRRFASAERDSLLPLADETPRAVEDAHAAKAGSCGCHRGERSACARCRERAAAAANDEIYF